jgi:hypothetical protein
MAQARTPRCDSRARSLRRYTRPRMVPRPSHCSRPSRRRARYRALQDRCPRGRGPHPSIAGRAPRAARDGRTTRRLRGSPFLSSARHEDGRLPRRRAGFRSPTRPSPTGCAASTRTARRRSCGCRSPSTASPTSCASSSSCSTGPSPRSVRSASPSSLRVPASTSRQRPSPACDDADRRSHPPPSSAGIARSRLRRAPGRGPSRRATRTTSGTSISRCSRSSVASGALGPAGTHPALALLLLARGDPRPPLAGCRRDTSFSLAALGS